MIFVKGLFEDIPIEVSAVLKKEAEASVVEGEFLVEGRKEALKLLKRWSMNHHIEYEGPVQVGDDVRPARVVVFVRALNRSGGRAQGSFVSTEAPQFL